MAQIEATSSRSCDFAKCHYSLTTSISRLTTRGCFHLLLLFPLEIGSIIQNPKRILRRTFVTRQFIQNTKSFCLIFQTHLFPVHLTLEVGNLFTGNPLGVLACLYRSSTLTYMPSIPLSLSLLRYSKEHVSQFLQSSFSRYYMSLRQLIRIILIIFVFVPSLEMS